MLIYHSGLTIKSMLAYWNLYPEVKLNAMISYGRRIKKITEFLFGYRKFLNRLASDCGTWTRNCNIAKYEDKITFMGYRSFLKIFSKRLDLYFNYDEDFSEAGFDKNLGYQLELERAGFNPVPVIHNCYSDEIQYYVDNGYKLIAIGSGELKYSGLDKLFDIVNPLYKKGVKVHFLGITDYRKLAYLPVYSCDSSSWGQAGARDYILWWNPHLRRVDKTDKVKLNENIWDYSFLDQLQEYLDGELELTIDDLVREGKRPNRDIVNIHHFVKLEKRINEKHRELGYKFVD